MRKLMYALMVALAACATTMSARAQGLASTETLYDAWRQQGPVARAGAEHFYLSGTVAALAENLATLRVGVGGNMSGYVVKVQGIHRIDQEQGDPICIPVGPEKRIAKEYGGFAELSVSMLTDPQINTYALTLQPVGSFDDARSVQILMSATEARPDAMSEVGAVDPAPEPTPTTVKCPPGCNLWSAVLKPPCKQDTMWICCTGNIFIVDNEKCTLRCYGSEQCPVVTPSDTTVTGSGTGSVN